MPFSLVRVAFTPLIIRAENGYCKFNLSHVESCQIRILIKSAVLKWKVESSFFAKERQLKKRSDRENGIVRTKGIRKRNKETEIMTFE